MSLEVLGALVRGWPDGEVVVIVRPASRPRSLAQNAFYWGACIAAVSEHTGYTPDEVHELAKQLFLPQHVAIADLNGEIVADRVVGGSTSRLSTADMHEFTERFRRWAAETVGVVIPDPVI